MKRHIPILWLVSLVLMLSCIFLNGTVDAYDTYHQKHFVLVHGGWHGAWCWYKVENLLKGLGCDVRTLDLPAHGEDQTVPYSVTLADYKNAVTRMIDSFSDAEKVVLVAHGSSASVINLAAEDRPDRIEKLIYIAGVLVPSGKTILEVLANDPGSIPAQNATVNLSQGTVTINPDVIEEAIYGLSPQEDIALAKRLMRPEPLVPLVTPLVLTDANFGRVSRYYIKTLADKTNTPAYQEEQLRNMPCKMVVSIYADHAAFFSCPEQLGYLIRDIALVSGN